MSKSLIFSLFTALALFGWQTASIAQTSRSTGGQRSSASDARRARGGGGNYTRINAGRARTAGVGTTVTARSAPSDQTDIKVNKDGSNGTLSNLDCVDKVTQCLEADNLCGPGLFGCQDRLPDNFNPNNSTQMATAVANLIANEGAMCADVMTQCQCYYNAEPYSNANCDLVWEQIVRQIATSSYDMGQCQTRFMKCAKKECAGENYGDCVDLIDTVINPDSADDTVDTLDAGEFLRDWLNNTSTATTQALSISLQSLLMQRLARCETNILARCEGYVSPIAFPVPSSSPVSDADRAMLYFFQDFARKAEEGLIDYQETHAKDDWLNAEKCVDKVDTCMKGHCGDGYKKCLHEDGTIDEIVTKNFKTLCQRTLIKCSEIRVEVGLPGYAFLQNPGVDGVEAVWNEFLTKKMLAHGTTQQADRRELERELDRLIATAQKECQESGGKFTYTKERLDIYKDKFGESYTDDYRGDSGVLHQDRGMEPDGDGWTHSAGNEEHRMYGTEGNYKKYRFYNRATCSYVITLEGQKMKNTPASKQVLITDNVMCDSSLFPEAEAKGGGLLGGAIGAVAGIVGGGLGGKAIGKSIDKDGDTDGWQKGEVIGGVSGAVLGGTAGAVAGGKVGQNLRKNKIMSKWACKVNGIPVAKWGSPILLPPGRGTASTGTSGGNQLYGGFSKSGNSGTGSTGLSAFDALDSFYSEHPELIVQRGEYMSDADLEHRDNPTPFPGDETTENNEEQSSEKVTICGSENRSAWMVARPTKCKEIKIGKNKRCNSINFGSGTNSCWLGQGIRRLAGKGEKFTVPAN